MKKKEKKMKPMKPMVKPMMDPNKKKIMDRLMGTMK